MWITRAEWEKLWDAVARQEQEIRELQRSLQVANEVYVFCSESTHPFAPMRDVVGALLRYLDLNYVPGSSTPAHFEKRER